MSEPVRVLLVDDHRMFREGIRKRLEEEADMTVVGEAASAEEAVSQVRQLSPDVVVLDIRLPGVTGVEVARRLREERPKIRILVLSGYDFDQYVRAMVRVGINGYMVKDSPQDDLVHAIREVAAGGAVLPSQIASKVLRQRSMSSASARAGLLAELTPREIEVVELMHNGLRNIDIAIRLSISPRTVENHVGSIFAKLGAASRAEAIRMALEKNLIK